MGYIVRAKQIFLENEILPNGVVSVENGVISEFSDKASCGDHINLDNLTLIPGLLDIHVHGGNLFDAMDLTHEAIDEISRYKLKEGVTSFCPTTVTTDLEKTKKVIQIVRECKHQGVEGAKIIGTFLEGPYINPLYKGAHPKEFIRALHLDEIKQLVEVGQGTIASFAIAPELKGAKQIIDYLKKENITVCMGHSAATFEQATYAIENGVSIGIHTFNGMSPLLHREPGMVGAILDHEQVFAEIIADMIHVNKTVIRVLLKCKGSDKVVLITDCMMAGGVKDGDYMLGEVPVSVRNGICRTREGALAGSTLSMNVAIKNMVKNVGVSVFDAVKMATITPARALGVDDKIGSIGVGKSADFVGIDDEFHVKFVMIDGKVMF